MSPAVTTITRAPPILDFSLFYGTDEVARNQLVQNLKRACQDKGFFQISNHGITPEMQEQIFHASKDFFALSMEEKMSLDKNLNKNFRGYECVGSQMLEEDTLPELKEGLYLGEDLPEDHPDVVAGKFNSGPNPWPPSLGDGFKKTCMEYYRAMFALARDLMRALALALDLEEGWFDDFSESGMGTLRFIHYPPCKTASEKSRGIGAHRDFGAITLLLQDEIGGLQVQDPVTDAWLDITPVKGALVVNLGNMMMRWTNHKYTSALHRVINVRGADRYSIPFFFNGNADFSFDVIPGCEDAGEGRSKYPRTSIMDFVKSQFEQSYDRASKYKEDSHDKS